MKTTLSNTLLTLTIDSAGAEVHSLKNNRTGHEYIWTADKRFWGRHSPILFPLVGQVCEGKYRMDGHEYQLGQHGFARDCEFTPVEDCPENEAWFILESSSDTLKLYPRRFRLEIGYRLDDVRVTVMWRVTNLDDRDMSFHIGAHPAFNYPEFNTSDAIHGFLMTDRQNNLTTQRLGDKGCILPGEDTIILDSHFMLPLTADTFAIHKTIILANNQIRRVSMLDKNRSPYLTMLFNAPVTGLWSPSPDAPFVCIEPWWGRCDSENFSDDFARREYTNTLKPGAEFNAEYMIIIDNI